MMRYMRRETLIYLILLLVLAAGGVALARRLPWPRAPYHPKSKAANGAMALEQWLKRMGYQVRPLPRTMSQPPADVDMIILFPSHTRVSDANAAMLHDWVAAGHTLVLVDMVNELAIEEQFGLGYARRPGDLFSPRLFQDIPLLPQAPAALNTSMLSAQSFDISRTPGALPALSHRVDGKSHPAVVVQSAGEGVVWHVTAQAAPTNEALQGQMGYLVPAWLRTTPEEGVIHMGLYHPFISDKKPSAPAKETLWGYMLRTAWGEAAVLAGALLLIFLLLQGRRLGPPLPVSPEIRRREAAEYVEAMARLKRRAHQRRAVARHQRRRLRAGLAEIWRVDANLPADALIAALQDSDDPPSPQLLRRIEAALSGLESDPSEAELVRLAAEIDAILSHR